MAVQNTKNSFAVWIPDLFVVTLSNRFGVFRKRLERELLLPDEEALPDEPRLPVKLLQNLSRHR